MIDLMNPGMATDHYLAGITIDNRDNISYTLNEVENSGNKNYDYAGSAE